MIAHDPTEQRENSLLPLSVLSVSQSCQHLEKYTGADLLISPLSAPVLKVCDESMPSRIALQKHLQVGLLVQRKSGRDFTSSIPRLAEILERMMKMCSRSWLLIVADLKCSSEGECILDGRDSGFSYAAVEGAIAWWQLRGGGVSILSREQLIPQWINGWLSRLRDLQTHPEKQLMRHRQQSLIKPDWRDTLTTFDNIDSVRANLIANHCQSLAKSLVYLTNSQSVKDDHIKDIGIETVRSVKRRMGLGENEVLQIAKMKRRLSSKK